MRWIRALAVSAVSILLIAAQHGPADSAGVRTYAGETAQLGNGTITTWMTTDGSGRPLSIGVNVSEDALSGLPDTETEHNLVLPLQASVTPFNHFTLDWLPHGHIPRGVYDVPHFDMHFYMMSPQQRDRITATGDDLARLERRPDARYIPQGYAAFPGGEPRMGAHWYYEGTPELHGRPFTNTLLYGFYNGRMVFIEPMVTRSYLLSRPNFRQDIRLPRAYQRPGYYPTRYAVRYCPARRVYVVALQGLTYRSAR